MIYANAPMFHNPTGWIPCTSSPTDAKYATLANLDGLVLSVQPDGSYQTRPAGTAGPWEVAEVAGDKRVYTVNGTTFVVLTVG